MTVISSLLPSLVIYFEAPLSALGGPGALRLCVGTSKPGHLRTTASKTSARSSRLVESSAGSAGRNRLDCDCTQCVPNSSTMSSNNYLSRLTFIRWQRFDHVRERLIGIRRDTCCRPLVSTSLSTTLSHDQGCLDLRRGVAKYM